MSIKNKIIAGWVGLMIAITPLTSNAGFMESFFDDVWVQTSSGGAFQSQLRGGLVGGSVSVRIPNRSISVINFTAPRLDAGCGGVDMNFGAFSFIDGDEIIQLLRTIGSQAKALLFQIAIDTINQMLGGLMKEFQQKIQSLNEMLKNSCDIANGVVDGILSPQQTMKNLADKWDTNWKNGFGVSDAFGDIKRKFVNPSDAFSTAMKKRNPNLKNPVFAAAVNNTNIAPLAYGLGSVDGKVGSGFISTLLISVTGTHLPPKEGCDATDKTSVDAKNRCAPQFTIIEPTISSIDELMNPGEREIYVCKEGSTGSDWGSYMANTEASGCSEMVKVKMKTLYKGTSAIVNKAMYGLDKADVTKAEIASSEKGIVGFLKGARSAGGLDTSEINFINGTDIPVFAMLKKVSRSPVAVTQVADVTSDMIARKMALRIAQDIIKVGTGLFSNASKEMPQKPADYDKNLDAFRKTVELMAVNYDAQATMNRVAQVDDYSNRVMRSLSTPMAAGATSAR